MMSDHESTTWALLSQEVSTCAVVGVAALWSNFRMSMPEW
jgi:hypothetical protein